MGGRGRGSRPARSLATGGMVAEAVVCLNDLGLWKPQREERSKELAVRHAEDMHHLMRTLGLLASAETKDQKRRILEVERGWIEEDVRQTEREAEGEVPLQETFQ